MFFQNPLKRLRSRLLCAIEITRSQSNCLHVMQSDSGNYTRRKNLSRFCYISRSTQKLYCMDFCRVNQNQHVPIMPRTTEKKRFHSRDQLTYRFLGTKESVYTRKEFNFQGIYLYTNMASVPLFWNTNMAAVTSPHEGTQVTSTVSFRSCCDFSVAVAAGVIICRMRFSHLSSRVSSTSGECCYFSLRWFPVSVINQFYISPRDLPRPRQLTR